MKPDDSTSLSVSKMPTDTSHQNMTRVENAHHYPNIYASSTQNISRLLERWMISSSSTSHKNQETHKECVNGVVESVDDFEFDLAFHNGCWDKMMGGDYIPKSGYVYDEKAACILHERKLQKQESLNNPPLTFFERWLLDESASHPEGVIEQQVN